MLPNSMFRGENPKEFLLIMSYCLDMWYSGQKNLDDEQEIYCQSEDKVEGKGKKQKDNEDKKTDLLNLDDNLNLVRI